MSITDLYQLFLECDGVSTDTRLIRSDSLYIALKGEAFNGDTFVYEALEKGAVAVIASESGRMNIESDSRFPRNADRIIFVPNTLATLQELARHHRRRFSIPVIAITGTNGKTTTKELTAAVLTEKFRIVKTEGNLNNQIGLPLTLLRIRASTEIVISEMGASKPGDIRELCTIALPTHGIITNIGLAHLEGFGSKEGVAKTKGELYEWLRDHGGTIFVNGKDADLAELLYRIDAGCKAQTIRYGEETVPENKNLFGGFNRINIQAAAAVGTHFKVPKPDMARTLKHYTPTNMRGQMLATKKGNDIILDAYNANPSSMKAALEAFATFPTTKQKWLILGDMKELGDASKDAHRNLLKEISFFCFTNVILIGEELSNAHGERKLYACFQTKEDFLASPFVLSIKNSAVLIKGSNSMRMWEISEKL